MIKLIIHLILLYHDGILKILGFTTDLVKVDALHEVVVDKLLQLDEFTLACLDTEAFVKVSDSFPDLTHDIDELIDLIRKPLDLGQVLVLQLVDVLNRGELVHSSYEGTVLLFGRKQCLVPLEGCISSLEVLFHGFELFVLSVKLYLYFVDHFSTLFHLLVKLLDELADFLKSLIDAIAIFGDVAMQGLAEDVTLDLILL